jgi:hypothetical protein
MLAVAALLVLGTLAPQAGPEAGPERAARVAVLPIVGDERLQVRLSAELRAQRFDAVGVMVDEAEAAAAPERALAEALRATSADAAIRVAPAAEAIRVWIAHAGTGKRLFREVVPEEGTHLDRALVAMWAVELLRASAVAPRVEARAAPPSPPAPLEADTALSAAPAVLLSPGGFGPSWHLAVGARRRLAGRLGVELTLLAPLVPVRVSSTAGAALITMGVACVGGYVASGAPGARASAQAGAGLAVVGLRATGDAADAFEGRTAQSASAGPYARAGGALRLSTHLRARLDALVGVVFPRPRVEFAETPVAHWGRPWTSFLLGVEAVF